MYFIFDTETNGTPGMKFNHIISFAYIILDKNLKEIEREERFLRREIPVYEWQPRAQDVHGITQEWMLKNGEEPYGIIRDLVQKINTCDFLIAHNSVFDYKILVEDCKRLKIDPPKIDHLCTLKMARKIWQKNNKLSEVGEKIWPGKIKYENLHGAMYDTRLCASIFYWIYKNRFDVIRYFLNKGNSQGSLSF